MNATTPTPVNVQQVVPFFTVSDMRASLKFYVDGLGFNIAHKWEPDGNLRWCSLVLGSASIMLQQRRVADAPPAKPGEGVIAHFICRDALAVYRDLSARGVNAPQEPFVSNSMWFFMLNDPDGYRIAFESHTNVREGMTMSEYEWTKA